MSSAGGPWLWRTSVAGRSDCSVTRSSGRLSEPGLSKAERGRLVRALAEAEHLGPDGRFVRVGRSTLDDWIRAYREDGFEALVSKPRVVVLCVCRPGCWSRRSPRSGSGRSGPRRRVIIMLAAGERSTTVCALQTHLARAGLNVRADGRSPHKVYGRFEAPVRNYWWTGDGLHGPLLAGSTARRAVLSAFIDDHSRLLVGWRWGTGEDVFRLEAALGPA